ncbi:MAG: TetR/AcrR family transcriptional regulator [Bacilli bacterium]|jgi:AcrR family transcriptional regulator
MPKTREQNEVIKRKRRGEIIQAGLKLFALKGYDNVTINNITTAAGCSHGLFYHYFNSKIDLLKSILTSIRSVADVYVKRFEEAEHNIAEIFSHIVRYVFSELNNPRNLLFAYRAHIWFTLHLQKTLPTEKKTKEKSLYLSPYVFIEQTFTKGQLSGKFKTNHSAPEYALIAFNLLQSIIYNRVHLSFRRFKAPAAETFINLFVMR